MRAETMHGLLTYLEEHPGADPVYHERSHGEAFTELLATKLVYMYDRGGFLVMDEPEAGLSLISQITLASQLAQLREHDIQVLIATHSPVLAATPGAQIIELDDDGFAPCAWNELSSVALYRRLLADPGFFGLG